MTFNRAFMTFNRGKKAQRYSASHFPLQGAAPHPSHRGGVSTTALGAADRRADRLPRAEPPGGWAPAPATRAFERPGLLAACLGAVKLARAWRAGVGPPRPRRSSSSSS